MDLRLGHQVFRPDDLVLWHDIAPDAVPLVGDHLAGAAAATGAGLVCTDPDRAVALGVRADGVILDAGTMPAAAWAAECVASGYPVLVTLAREPERPGGNDHDNDGHRDDVPGDGPGDVPDDGPDVDVVVEAADAGVLAAASVYAWLGVRVFRPLPTHAADAALRQVLDMVASIRGTRPPALSRRALG
ncbi:MAG TPA: hypothetical protein VF069_29295 [Streptosporangiaceae bacterium]